MSSTERDEIVAVLTKHRGLFLVTVQGLDDEQARLTPTVSALSLGGLVKHVTATVAQWLDFVEHGPQGGRDRLGEPGPGAVRGVRERVPPAARRDPRGRARRPGTAVAARTDALVRERRPRRDAPAAAGAVVPAGRGLEQPARVHARAGRDRPARRPRRHPAREHRRPEVDGLSRRRLGRETMRIRHRTSVHRSSPSSAHDRSRGRSRRPAEVRAPCATSSPCRARAVPPSEVRIQHLLAERLGDLGLTVDLWPLDLDGAARGPRLPRRGGRPDRRLGAGRGQPARRGRRAGPVQPRRRGPARRPDARGAATPTRRSCRAGRLVGRGACDMKGGLAADPRRGRGARAATSPACRRSPCTA